MRTAPINYRCSTQKKKEKKKTIPNISLPFKPLPLLSDPSILSLIYLSLHLFLSLTCFPLSSFPHLFFSLSPVWPTATALATGAWAGSGCDACSNGVARRLGNGRLWRSEAARRAVAACRPRDIGGRRAADGGGEGRWRGRTATRRRWLWGMGMRRQRQRIHATEISHSRVNARVVACIFPNVAQIPEPRSSPMRMHSADQSESQYKRNQVCILCCPSAKHHVGLHSLHARCVIPS